MDKQELMKICTKDDDKILIAKLLDKIQFVSQRNQIQFTHFLDGYEQKLALKVLQQVHYKTYIFFGGYKDAERKMLFLFPERLFDLLHEPFETNKMIQNEIQVISIILPNDLKNTYHHRDYLSGIMKLGVKREKAGDILVREDGSDIIVQTDISEYLLSNLHELTRFRKSKFITKSISELEIVSIRMEDFTILVPQLRLDTVVAEILHTSRTKANEVISSERILVNYEIKTKNSLSIVQGDLLTIRGKGKYKIGRIVSQTSKGKLRVEISKYIS